MSVIVTPRFSMENPENLASKFTFGKVIEVNLNIRQEFND